MPAVETEAVRLQLGERLTDAVREAGALALKMRRPTLRSWTKKDASPVSEADLAVDRLLHRRLIEAAPGSGWLSEESEDDEARLSARMVWIVDPIDGTRAYLTGRPDWVVAAALIEDGRPIVAALFAPVEQALFLAIAGCGATLDGAPIAVSAGSDLAGARVAGPQHLVVRLDRLAPRITPVPKIYSLALRLARVADGTLDVAFASPSSHDWDLAAADLLVHEAGGALTTIEGRMLTYNRTKPIHGALVAAGRARHERLVELLRGRTAAGPNGDLG